jgi:SAM-dependent methyltransferase
MALWHAFPYADGKLDRMEALNASRLALGCTIYTDHYDEFQEVSAEMSGGESQGDRWATWLLKTRHGGDADYYARLLPHLYTIRDEVLERASLEDCSVLLDVGAGDGLIAFGALERLKPSGRVIFSEISPALLEYARALVEQLGESDRVEFVLADATNLTPIADASVDVVTTRSVLIYVKEKRKAFSEFFRVLRPGGRISLAEPINRETGTQFPEAIADLEAILRAKNALEEDPATNPMLDFTERDLLRFAHEVGFSEVHIDLRIDLEPREPIPWETYLSISPNPNAPTMREYLASAFTAQQSRRYEACLRPLIESGKLSERRAMAYLWAKV